jgi:hypothetical protein
MGNGLGNDLVALGIIRKVDAGARTFLSSGFGVFAVCSNGSTGVRNLVATVTTCLVRHTDVCEEACAWDMELK